MIFGMQIHSYAALIQIVIRNGLPNPDGDADRHQNVISWCLGHTPAVHKISSKSVGNFFDNAVKPSSKSVGNFFDNAVKPDFDFGLPGA